MRFVPARALWIVLLVLVAAALVAAPIPASGADDESNPSAADAGSDDGAYLLRYKFEPNQFVHYEVNHRMAITTQKGQASETAVNESTTRKHYRVASVDEDGNGVLEPTIDHVKMSAKFGKEDPVLYDSDSETAPPKQFEQVKNTVGRPLARLKITPNGELLSATALHDTLQTERPSSDDTIEAPAVDQNLNFLIIFPDDAIKVGEEWKDRLTVKVSITGSLKRDVELSRRYKLVSVKDGQATIELKTTVITPINDPGIRGQLIQRTPSGSIVFDMDQGTIVSREISLDKIEVGIAGADSSMRAVSRRRERLLAPDEVAERTASNADETDAEQQ